MPPHLTSTGAAVMLFVSNFVAGAASPVMVFDTAVDGMHYVVAVVQRLAGDEAVPDDPKPTINLLGSYCQTRRPDACIHW